MRVYLRNRQTRLYCASPKGWAVAIAQALLFSSVRQAARFAFHERVPETEIVDALFAEIDRLERSKA